MDIRLADAGSLITTWQFYLYIFLGFIQAKFVRVFYALKISKTAYLQYHSVVHN